MIVELKNISDKTTYDVWATALFYKDGKLVQVSDDPFYDSNGSVEVGDTGYANLFLADDYDDYKIYVQGTEDIDELHDIYDEKKDKDVLPVVKEEIVEDHLGEHIELTVRNTTDKTQRIWCSYQAYDGDVLMDAEDGLSELVEPGKECTLIL